jgi:hypothetical protein
MWIYREHLSSTNGQVFINANGTLEGRNDNLNEEGSWDEILFSHD